MKLILVSVLVILYVPAFAVEDAGGIDWQSLGICVVAAESTIVLACLCLLGLRGLRKLSASVLVMLFVLAVGTSIVAQKTNGVNSLPPMPLRSAPVVETVSEDDVSRGWRVDSVTTNETVSYTMPSNAVYVGNWHVHGARSSFGRNVIDFGAGWSFPLGTSSAAFSSFWYFVDGRIRPTPKDAAHEICAVGVPMSAVPGQSQLWTLAEDDDSRVLTWENFFLGGDTNSPVNAQIRLFANGDFTTRSNDVETVCRRVNPDDWDGDGLANEKDENPFAYDGDFFGTANAMPTNANLDAYYQLDVAAVGALDFATIRVTCDGPSALGDHVVIARTNQVCHVPLLAGATYAVESDLPIAYSAVSSEHAHIVTNSATKLTVSLPLEFTVERIQTRDVGGALNYGVRSSPVDVYPEVSAVTGGCCTVTGGEACFSWSCSEGCRCSGGDHSLWVSATWGGYRLAFPATAGCPCSHVAEQDENGASVRVSFTNEVVVFESAYTNAPGEVVSRRSTSTLLSCRADGGRFGGTVAVALSDGGRLLRTQGTDLPGTATVPAGGAVLLSAEYEALSESASEGDIVATAVFTENMTGRQLTNETTLTAVRVELTPEVFREGALHRHRVGIGEVVGVEVSPSLIGWTVIVNGNGSMTNMNDRTAYLCPFNAEENTIIINMAASTHYKPLLSVVEPTGVVAFDVCAKAYLDAEVGIAGWAGMTMDLYVEPLTVAFGQIEIAEVPEYGEGIAPTGYFATNAYENIWHHTEARGAGTWHAVRIDNMFLPDNAELGERLGVTPWTSGQITWRIPIAWRRTPLDEYDYREPHEFGTPYYQLFNMNANGTLRVTKLQDFWVERDPDGVRRKSHNVGGAL